MTSLLIALFAAASVIDVGASTGGAGFGAARHLVVAASLAGLAVKGTYGPWMLSRRAAVLLVVWMLYACSVLSAGIANNDPVLVQEGAWSLVGVPFFFFFLIPSSGGERVVRSISVALLLSQVPYLVLSLLLVPFTPHAYAGVFTNPNALGLSVAGFTIAGLTLLPGTASRAARALLRFALAGGTVITLATSSRTSLLAIVFSAMILVALSKHALLTFMKVLVALLVVSSLAWAVWGSDLAPMVLEKFDSIAAKSAKADLLTGRGLVWRTTIMEAAPLGHGSSYFNAQFGFAGHNSLIETLGKSGAVAAFGLAGFGIGSLLLSFSFYRRHRVTNPLAVVPLLMVVAFWSMSMGEVLVGSLGKALTLAYLSSCGVVLSSDARREAGDARLSLPRRSPRARRSLRTARRARASSRAKRRIGRIFQRS